MSSAVVVVPLGRLPEADLHYSEVLVDRELALGTTHPITLLALGNLAHQTAAQQEKIADAESMFREELAAHAHALGTNHPSVLQAKLALARTLAHLGQASEATTLVREVSAAADTDVSSGTGLPDASVAILYGCASVLQLLGADADADALLRKALQKVRSAPAQTAESSAEALALCLALERSRLKTPDAAKQAAEARRAWAERALSGPPAALVAGTNLASRLLQPRWLPDPATGRLRYQHADWVLSDQSALRAAEPVFELAHDARRAAVGAGHAHALTALGNLAVCRLALGRAEEAERLFRERLAGLRALGLPAGDAEVQECTVNVARALEVGGKLEEARELYAAVAEREALEEGAAASGALLGRMLDLARCEAALGNAAEAEALLQETHDNCVDELGFGHPCTRVCAYVFAQFLQDHDKLDQAEALLEDFRQGSAPENAAEVLKAEPPVALGMISSVGGLLRVAQL